VKVLEEDVALVSGQCDALNVQIRLATARVGTLTKEVTTLKETVRERDEALSSTGQEIETLRATIHDKDEALRAGEKRTTSCVIRLWAGRPMQRVSFCLTLALTLDSYVFADLIS
jgi:chromosome segregation ATPase